MESTFTPNETGPCKYCGQETALQDEYREFACSFCDEIQGGVVVTTPGQRAFYARQTGLCKVCGYWKVNGKCPGCGK